MARRSLPISLLLFALAGCAPGSRSSHGTTDAAPPLSSADDLALGEGADINFIDPGGQPDTSDCANGNAEIYLISVDAHFYKFNPANLQLTTLGLLACPSLATPYSMSVDRQGHAWVVFTDGTLYDVDTATLACKATNFTPGQSGFTTFGMGFSSNGNGNAGAGETLFVSEAAFNGLNPVSKGLAHIDLKTLKLTAVGPYDKIGARAEMTGTGDGRLFAAFEGSPYIVAQINKTNAHIMSQAPQKAINYAPDSSNFAFAFWGGDFWLFVGPGTSTDVFQYKPSNGTTTKRLTLTQEIVGAGVSTCAPVQPPG